MPLSPILSTLRVVDLTTMIAGTTAARLLAELGADVVHVEPLQGDDGRNSTTSFLGREGIFNSIANRNKRGIVVDYRSEAGAAVVKRLVARADVFIENTTPGSLAAIGLGYEDVRAVKEDIIYLSVSGWGHRGDFASLPGYDILIQAFTGAMRSPSPDEPPAFSSALIGDPTAPLLGAFAVLAALHRRNQTGAGAHVQTSILQGALHLLGSVNLLAQEDPNPDPSTSGGLPGGSGVFRTADELYVVIAAWNDAQFGRLAVLADYPHLAADPELATRPLRVRRAPDVNALIEQWVGSQDRESLLELLRQSRIPCSPVHSNVVDLYHSEQLRDVGFVVPIEHPKLGVLWQAGPGYTIDDESPQLRPAPAFGADTESVLLAAGFTPTEISRLVEEGTVCLAQ